VRQVIHAFDESLAGLPKLNIFTQLILAAAYSIYFVRIRVSFKE
jgi:hypothetical protein